ncbi:hypothetical protein JKF63_02588 [Porcisia hertigi]|uniref:CS domain-containing protein n=1 Tax=Porcisia hertigi TaxID=2761500 RepID=A0A836H9T0_9TRYP|nr:hypothetical protein JKF63_02588 [Porcisia hertigi]
MSAEEQEVTSDSVQAAAAVTSKKQANSYYYWHGHEKERAKVGDVAPMPTPQLVSKDDAATVAAPAVPTMSVSKYSWCDEDKFVSVYIDTVALEGETLDGSSVEATFKDKSLKVEFVTADRSGKTRTKCFSIRLSKRIDKDRCLTKVKPKTQQILVRLAKKVESTWMDLEGKANGHDSASGDDASDAE